MDALVTLRNFFGEKNVSYEPCEAEGDYYKITFRGYVPDYELGREEWENVGLRNALGDAMRLQLVDFILGSEQRVNQESVMLFDKSNSDYSRYDFEFQIPADNINSKNNLPLQSLTQQEAEAFKDTEQLKQWMYEQAERNAEANRMLFRRSDGDTPGWSR